MSGSFEKNANLAYIEAEAISFACAGTPEVGQEVYLSGNNTVAIRTLATQRPIGVVATKVKDGVLAIRNAIFDNVITALAKGGTLAAGALVMQDGTVNATSLLPNYVAVATGNLASGIVLSGGAAAAEIKVGLLNGTVVAP